MAVINASQLALDAASRCGLQVPARHAAPFFEETVGGPWVQGWGHQHPE